MSVLVDHIRAVLADGSNRTATEVLAGLRSRGLSPQDADPLGRIRYELAAGKKTFERVVGERGSYRLIRRPAG